MKAVILEKRDGYSAVLREDGVIEKLKIQGEVGDTVFVDPDRGRKKARIYRFAQVAAAAMLFLVAGMFARYYVFTPSSYVTMDVNPSVEFSMNRLNRVIEAEAVNEDADEIVASLKENRIWGSSLEEIIEETTQILEDQEYLSGSDSAILFAVSAENESSYEQIEANIRKVKSTRSDISIEILRGEPEDHNSARKFSLSLGRYLKMKDNVSGSGTSTGESENPELFEPDEAIISEYRKLPVSDMLGRGNAEVPAEERTENGTGTETGAQPGTQGEERPEAAVNGNPSEERPATGTEEGSGRPDGGTEAGAGGTNVARGPGADELPIGQ